MTIRITRLEQDLLPALRPRFTARARPYDEVEGLPEQQSRIRAAHSLQRISTVRHRHHVHTIRAKKNIQTSGNFSRMVLLFFLRNCSHRSVGAKLAVPGAVLWTCCVPPRQISCCGTGTFMGQRIPSPPVMAVSCAAPDRHPRCRPQFDI